MTANEDTELWRLARADRVIVCRQREVRGGLDENWDSQVTYELRVEHQVEIYLTEVHKDRTAFVRRVGQLRDALEAEGWTDTTKAERREG